MFLYSELYLEEMWFILPTYGDEMNETGLQRVVSTFKSHHWPDEQPNKSGNDPRKSLRFWSLIQ